MDSAVMDRPLPGASPDMAQHKDQIVMQYLEQMDRQDILDSPAGVFRCQSLRGYNPILLTALF